jgi:hypothetical protein
MAARFLIVCVFVASCLLSPAAALADASIVLVNPDGETSIQVREGRVRISESENPASIMIFDASDRSLTLMDASQRTYTRVDEASAREIRQQIESAIEEAEEQIKALPPQQQEMMRSMMAEVLNYGEKVPRVEIRRDGGRDTVDGVACERITMTYDGEPGLEACIAGHEELGISKADNDAVVAMFGFLTDFANTVMPSGSKDGWELSGMDGIPVLAKDAADGEVSRLKSVNDDSLSPDLFGIPDGFSEKPLSVD